MKSGSAEIWREAKETIWRALAWLSSGTYVSGLPPRWRTARCWSADRSMMGAARALLEKESVCRLVRLFRESAAAMGHKRGKWVAAPQQRC